MSKFVSRMLFDRDYSDRIMYRFMSVFTVFQLVFWVYVYQVTVGKGG